MSPGASRGLISCSTLLTTPAGTMITMARGGASSSTNAAMWLAPVAPSAATAATASGSRSVATQLCPAFISRRTMLAPMRPSPIMPICIHFSLLAKFLAGIRTNRKQLDVFFCDERGVPLTHPDSNFRQAKELWLDAASLSSDQVHPLSFDGSLESGAHAYE